MKKKFRLWLNIATICLCICAIAVGVYAATSASLNIQGQIGFSAHGCDIDASGYMYGYATEEDGQELPQSPPAQDGTGKVMLTQTTETTGYNTPNVAELRGANGGLDLGDKMFTDINSNADGKPTDIVIVLTLTNQSLFDIYGVVSATSTKGNIGITKSAGLFNLGKKVGTTVKSIDVTITLSVYPDKDGNYNDITGLTADNVHISIDFNKGKVEDNLLKKDTTNNYYYVEMGTHTYTNAESQQVTEPLRWYAFAYKGTSASEYGSATTTAVTDYTSGSYYFISERALLMSGSNTGVAWGEYDADATHFGIDYAYESTIRPLVNDQDAGSVYSTYGMSTSSIYKAITNRDLAGETYKIYNDALSKEYVGQYTTRTTYNQTLWLLSSDEANNHFATDADRKTIRLGGTASEFVWWWLRNPLKTITSMSENNPYICIYNVFDNGYIDCDTFDATHPGVRPGFQLDIDLSGGVVAA